tara:strand:- start:311 stop:610 length:300 start_codon:yes stop_codon:yes gene_type:complete
MNLTFKESDDKLEFEIKFNGMYIGHTKLNIWTQKWQMVPAFNLPYNFTNVSKNKFDSSYQAGKEMVKLYNFLFPFEEDQGKQEPSTNLNDMLVFLKERK